MYKISGPQRQGNGSVLWQIPRCTKQGDEHIPKDFALLLTFSFDIDKKSKFNFYKIAQTIPFQLLKVFLSRKFSQHEPIHHFSNCNQMNLTFCIFQHV